MDAVFSTLFSPPTPRASPAQSPPSSPSPIPRPPTASPDRLHRLRLRLLRLRPFAEDPLHSASSSTAHLPFTPLQNYSFLDRCAEDAKTAADRKRREVLDELLQHEDDPLYWLQPSKSTHASGTSTRSLFPPPVPPKEELPPPEDQPLVDLTNHPPAETPPRRPTPPRPHLPPSTRRTPRNTRPPPASKTRPRPPSSPHSPHPSAPLLLHPLLLPLPLGLLLLSSAVRPASSRASTDGDYADDERLPAKSALDLASPPPLDLAITHGTPFAAHPYVPPSGAPGFEGDRRWDKGFEFDKTGVERRSVALTGRKPATTPVLTVALADKVPAPDLPALARLPRAWALLYSLDEHGISLQTLYARCARHAGGTLLVVRDAGDALFGAWTGEGIHLSKGAYYGSGEAFLWREARDGGVRVFRWTGRNDYVALCEPGYISFGGGEGHYGCIWTRR
ncbi:Oxidation resistance protein 1 [Grifola frondosa]|uniref:Oxidation resistance protein 1 n=1 Tax=Grifola frondosa TaxID=5627 RepID=A0A1C7MEL7_GRIFR|nr:Oxidation resistance protein 1 [Grifola frondosa]